MADIFVKILSGSNIAKKFTAGWIKVMYFAAYGITPYFKLQLKSCIENSDIMVVLFNEILSGIIQTCKMGIVFCHWDCTENCMRVCY